MSPLASPPNRGYADWQRVTSWDDEPFWNFVNNDSNLGGNSGVQDVSRFSYLGGQWQCTVNMCQMVVDWWTDAGPSNHIGQRTFTLTGAMAAVATFRIPHLGPFCQVTMEAIAAGVFQANVSVFNTNRYNPLEMIATEPVMIGESGFAIGGSSTATFYPTTYYAGPMMLTTAGSQSFQPVANYLTPDGVWSTFWATNPIAAGGWQTEILIMPEAAWSINIENASSSGGSFDVYAVPSITGAS